MRLTTVPHHLVHCVRNRTRLGEKFAALWHRWAPPVPVYKRFYGLKVCLNLRDNLFYLASSARETERNERFHDMLAGVRGTIWDIGCNVGIFSLLAASRGLGVVAFDISPEAIRLLEKSMKANDLSFPVVCQAFAAEKYSYSPPRDADTRNVPARIGAGGSASSITFHEAAARFGIPAFIKVDIEHHEVALLKSGEFRDWIKANHVPLLVELHDAGYRSLIWNDVEHLMFDHTHVLFNPLPDHRASVTR